MAKKRPAMIFILGPTGVGKSRFAVTLAKKIGGEIISCDSMQIYKGMAIMSQQPARELQRSVPHHLVGILRPSGEWSAADFIEKAVAISGDIVRRKKIPIVVGGTGLYARALIRGLFPAPPKDEKFRKALYEEAERKGKALLYRRLLKIDPAYASRIHPNDLRRIARALEVHRLTGRPISEEHKKTKGIGEEYKISIFILTREREELYNRINERTGDMFARGIAEEVKRLRHRKMSRTAKSVLGYREVSNYLNGKLSMEEAKELLKKNTRHYAKRQLTWFRKEKNAKWLKLGAEKENIELINKIIRVQIRQ